MTSPRPKILHAITVYNGRDFVPRCIESAVGMDRTECDFDVLVLDDASSDKEFSREIEALCRKLSAHYYCTPKNIGIPRNFSLGMNIALANGYDYVTINNSDVIFPKNLISQMVGVFEANKNVGSVTAWSNDVSIFSILNCSPDKFLAAPEVVNQVSDVLARRFKTTAIDIPTAVGFCFMISSDAIRKVGVMDPIFGRGYCEENDWSLRSLTKGYRICLAPGTFVYHMGRGSNLAAGIVATKQTTVLANELIIDDRYPEFRKQVLKFEATGKIDELCSQAIEAIQNEAISRLGYSLNTSWQMDSDANREYDFQIPQAIVEVDDGVAQVSIEYLGFKRKLPLTDGDVTKFVTKVLNGKAPSQNRFELSATPRDGEPIQVSSYPR